MLARRVLLCTLLVASAQAAFHTTSSVRFASRSQPRPAFVARRSGAVVAVEDDAEDAFRMLGLQMDSTYDQIMDAHLELTERYQDDLTRIGALDAAKEKVLDYILSQRMAGAAARYEGMTAAEDRPPPKKTPLWVHANDFRKKFFERPTLRYAGRVFLLIGGLTFAAWMAPNTAGMILLLNVVSAMGFIYNRGEAEVKRDDFGQIGEIRPMKPKPFMLTCGITAFIWILGFVKAKQIAATVIDPPRGFEVIMRTTLISLGLIIPSLFVKVHPLFD